MQAGEFSNFRHKICESDHKNSGILTHVEEKKMNGTINFSHKRACRPSLSQTVWQHLLQKFNRPALKEKQYGIH
ncbi:hypothetical protein QH637_03925 [Heyndrickxia coagulans]|jgi:hypothetical protein